MLESNSGLADDKEVVLVSEIDSWKSWWRWPQCRREIRFDREILCISIRKIAKKIKTNITYTIFDGQWQRVMILAKINITITVLD